MEGPFARREIMYARNTVWGVFSWTTGFIPPLNATVAEKMASILTAAEVAERYGDGILRDALLEQAVRLEAVALRKRRAA